MNITNTLNEIDILLNRKKSIESLIEIVNKPILQTCCENSNILYSEIYKNIINNENMELRCYSNYYWYFFEYLNEINNEYEPFIKSQLYIKNQYDKTKTHLWKVFMNVKMNCINNVLKNIITICVSKKIPFHGKIPTPTNPRSKIDCNEPRLLFYFYDTVAMKNFVDLVNNRFKNEENKILCDVNSINIKTRNMKITIGTKPYYFDVPQIGPSFTKSYNKFIYYGQSGFSESERQNIVEDYCPKLIKLEIDYYLEKRNIDTNIFDITFKKFNLEYVEKRILKIQKYILNLLFDGPNFYKYIGYIDPLEDSLITNKRNKLLTKINNFENVTSEFNSLLFTHNTNIENFLKIIGIDNGNIQSLQPGDRGVQFRYGLDSQYGEIKFIMKKNNYLLKSFIYQKNEDDIIVDGKDIIRHSVTANDPNYFNFWKRQTFINDNLNKELKTEAKMYNFRNNDKEEYDYYNAYKNNTKHILSAWTYCIDDEKKKPSWCSIQLHLENHVDLRHVEYVIIPKFMFSKEFQTFINDNNLFEDILKTQPIGEYINKMFNLLEKDSRANYLYNKIIINENADDYTKYYSVISESVHIPKYLQILKQKINSIVSADVLNGTKKGDYSEQALMYRNKGGIYGDGNSSQLSVNIENFKFEEQLYMKILLYNNCFLENSAYDIEHIKQKIIETEKDIYLSESDM